MRLRFNRNLRIGLAMLGLIAAASIIGPVLLGVDPIEVDFTQTLLPPGPGHWLGTDDLGRTCWRVCWRRRGWTYKWSRSACSCRS